MAWTLIADIGGTNLRIARAEAGEIQDLRVLSTAGESDLIDAFQDFCKEHGTPTLCCAAVAAVVENGAARMTNARQELRSQDLQLATGAQSVRLINDFEAAAWYLMSVSEPQASCLSGPTSIQQGTRVVVGPGTGLGVGMLVFHDGKYFAAPSEGGHTHIAPVTKFEAEVFMAFRSLWPEFAFGDTLALEAEALLSGIGLPKLYAAVSAVYGSHVADVEIQEILFSAPSTEINQTLQIFRTHLGRFCGDLAIGSMAKGGVFLTGGVAQKNPWLFDTNFVEAFRQGGRFTNVRQEIGMYLCHDEQTGLLGARNASLFMS